MSTKEKIKSAALSLLSKEGYSGTSMRKIGKLVGIRESAIYNHYKSKDAIITEIFNDIKSKSGYTDLLTDELLDKLNKPKEFLKDFSFMLLERWASGLEQQMFGCVLVEQFNKRYDKVSINDLIAEMKKIWEMIFREMINYKFIRENNPSVLADEFIAPLFFIRLKYFTADDKERISYAEKDLLIHIDFFWDSIKR
ncbi:MAG: TetR/AcrR family transcriptional regulator [Melioribacteraceae bacterium]|nr:TetR/AcrR family transcriptional regulator [Melioribacteraceae bacterium]